MACIRQKDIAERLGVSVQTVSLAMRGRGNVSKAMCQRVLSLAEEMGYEFDPAMAALCAYRTQTRKTGRRWDRIAVAHDWPSMQQWRQCRFSSRVIAGIEQAVQRRGLSIEYVWLGHCSEHAGREFRRLKHQGISGLIIAPHSPEETPTTIPLPEGQFDVVTCGPEHLYPNCHTVQFDYYENLRLAWQSLRDKGNKRIGLVYDAKHDWRTGGAWLGAYYVQTRAMGIDLAELPPHAIGDASAESVHRLEQWARDCQPDAIISSSYRTKKWLGPDFPHIYVAEMNPETPDTPGVDLNMEQMTDSVVDLLTMEMQRSLYSPARTPYRLHIPGRWVERGVNSVVA